jgi:hypothetical protein
MLSIPARFWWFSVRIGSFPHTRLPRSRSRSRVFPTRPHFRWENAGAEMGKGLSRPFPSVFIATSLILSSRVVCPCVRAVWYVSVYHVWTIRPVCTMYTWYSCSWPPIYLSILSPARPGPGPARVRPAHEPYWTGVGRDLEAREKFFWPEPGMKCCF